MGQFILNGIQYAGGGAGSIVSVSQLISTGTKIGTITVDSIDTDLYAPNPGSVVAVTPIIQSGTKLATIDVDGSDFDIYAPNTAATVEQNPTNENKQFEVLLSGTDDNLARIEETNKTNHLKFNSYERQLYIDGSTEEGTHTYNYISMRSKFGYTAPSTIRLSTSNPSSSTGAQDTILDISCSPTRSYTDITLTGDTWDGTNTSIKTAITTAAGSVTQTASDSGVSGQYEVLLSGTADNTTRTEGARKTSKLYWHSNAELLSVYDISNNRGIGLQATDVVLTSQDSSNTWDGTNTSLKTSVSSMLKKTGDTLTGDITLDCSQSQYVDQRPTIVPSVHEGTNLGEDDHWFNYAYAHTNLCSSVVLQQTTGVYSNAQHILRVTYDDIKFAVPTGSSLTPLTWDGTNVSLADAIQSLSNRITALGG